MVLQLLARLYSVDDDGGEDGSGTGKIADGDDLPSLVPRLWPMLRHSLSTVRRWWKCEVWGKRAESRKGEA